MISRRRGQITYPELPSLVRTKYLTKTLPEQWIIQGAKYSGSPPADPWHAWWTADKLGSYRTSKRQRGVRFIEQRRRRDHTCGSSGRPAAFYQGSLRSPGDVAGRRGGWRGLQR